MSEIEKTNKFINDCILVITTQREIKMNLLRKDKRGEGKEENPQESDGNLEKKIENSEENNSKSSEEYTKKQPEEETTQITYEEEKESEIEDYIVDKRVLKSVRSLSEILREFSQEDGIYNHRKLSVVRNSVNDLGNNYTINIERKENGEIETEYKEASFNVEMTGSSKKYGEE